MEDVTIRPRDLDALRSSGRNVELIDVRTPGEFREMHVPFARNVPLGDLDAVALARGRGNEPLYVICRSGMRGKQACEKLSAAGIASVVNVEGGTLAWAECGLTVVRGKKTLPLDRQVRIVIGLMVVLGSLLSWFVDPIFTWVTASVGLGLIYAGATDTCFLAMLMARLPWNRAGGKLTSSASQCTVSPAPASAG